MYNLNPKPENYLTLLTTPIQHFKTSFNFSYFSQSPQFHLLFRVVILADK